jgi:ribosomal protein S18 acetylase RimI-like enzyme
MIIEEFKEKHLEEAAKLFQKDYLGLKAKYSYLPNKYESLEIICSNLKAIISEYPSLIAIRSNHIIGYISGYSNIKKLKGSFLGSYIPEWGHSAVLNDREMIYENLYTKISRFWVKNKNFTHIISFLLNTELISIFSILGFGMQVIDAIRNLDPVNIDAFPEYSIELAAENHISQLREFNFLINKHLESSPIFLKRDTNKISDKRIIEDFLSNDSLTLLAIANGEIVSCIRGKKNHGNISVIDERGTFGINFGYTKIEYRKTGIASKLLNELFKIAQNNDTTFCSVDFESQNIEGRRFWLKHFTPIAYSMIRKIDDRIK